MEDVKIKVSTEALQNKAETVEGLLGAMVRQYDDLYRQIKNTAAYWKGEASAKSMERCEKDRELMTTMLQRLREYPQDLREMAGIYAYGEKAAQDESSALPFDVIV